MSVLCRTDLARAQVSTNQGALDSLGASPPPVHAAPATRPPAVEHPARPALRHDAPHAAAKPKGTAARPPAIPAAPPPKAVLPPAEPTVPTRPSPPPPVPVVPDAPDTVSAIPGGTRVTFGAGRSDLNPDTVSALRDLARSAKADPTAILDVNAWSAGTSDDPSTPRRLSLARALAVRAVLISEGIASPRIYVRALGSDSGDVPDRAEITRAAAMPASGPAQPAPQPAPATRLPPAPPPAPARGAPAGPASR